MYEATPPSENTRLTSLYAALDQGMLRAAARMVNALHPAEIASLLESLPPAQREAVWGLLDAPLEGSVLVELNESVRNAFLQGMHIEDLAAAAGEMELDDRADLIGGLPEAVTRQLLRSMDQRDHERLRTMMSFPGDTAGGLMNADTVSVRPDVSVDVVLRYLRMRGELPERTDSLFIVDRNDRYLGSVALTRLVTEEPERLVAEMVAHEAPRIDPHTPAQDVAQLFENRDLVSAAVVTEDGRLLGRITVDDVVDVIREEAEHSVLSMGGLRHSADAFANVLASVRQRTPWLAVSFGAALVTSSVVRNFEDTIQITAILAALMPIVASMGGIAGTQTVTLIIRGLALGQIQASNASWLLFKEMAVGGLNGFACAAAIALITALWLDHWTIALLVSAAIFVNLLAAALAGVTIPLVLRRFRLDPALGAGVLLTTCTDVVGFATLLGMAAWILR